MATRYGLRPRTKARRWPTLKRWIRFNFVGAIGIVVQLTTLKLLVAQGTRVQVATVVAVECAVLNNFFWHLRFTWSDCRSRNMGDVLQRCLRFHLTNGALSLAASWALMGLLVVRAELPFLAANVICIAACSVLNFLMAEVLVFRRKGSRTCRGRRKQVLMHFGGCVEEF